MVALRWSALAVVFVVVVVGGSGTVSFGQAQAQAPAPAPVAAPPVSPSRRTLAAQPGDALLLTVGDDASVAHVDRDGLTSQSVDLHRSGTGLEGHVGVASVSLGFGPGRITGQIGDDPVALDVVRVPGALHVMGRFGIRRVAFELAPQVVGGDLGSCFYSLRLQTTDYAGDVTCGGQPQPVQLQIPVALIERSDVELAALLVAVLAR
jgi:hypothetical protein